MTNGRGSSDKWFTFLLAIVIALISALGGLQFFLNSQLWTKLDRVTALVCREADALHSKVDKTDAKVDKTVDSHIGILQRLTVLESNGNNNNNKGKK